MRKNTCFRLDEDAVLTPLKEYSKKHRYSQAWIVETALIEYMKPKKPQYETPGEPKYYADFEGPFTIKQLIKHLKDSEDVAIRTEEEYESWLHQTTNPL
jgi:hypothetical protein